LGILKFDFFYKTKTKCLVGESKAAHTRLDAEDIVVGREHVHGGRVTGGVLHNLDLRVVDAGEVAGAGGLVLLGLERERVRVDTGHGRTSVVVVGLHLVEVLTTLLLETVLAVEDELEGVEGTADLLDEAGVTTDVTGGKEGRASAGGGRRRRYPHQWSQGWTRAQRWWQRRRWRSSTGSSWRRWLEKHHTSSLTGWFVREAHLLGTGRGDGVGAGVLDLLDQVLVTLLGEAAALLGVKVHVVGPHLEGVGVKEGVEIGREVDVDAHLVVLEGDEGKVETGVAVEEEDEGEVDGLAGTRSGHLAPRSLLGLVQVKLGVQTPPLLVVLVDTLTTDGKLDVVDGTLGDEVAVTSIRGAGGGDRRLELEVHVTDKVTVTGDSDGHAAGVGGSTVDGLLDVLHREVGVALVFRLEEGHLRVTGEVNVLGAVRDELHKTTGHFESCCTI
jgi:hypothetical protein